MAGPDPKTAEPEIPMILKGHRLHAELNREHRDGLREGFIVGAICSSAAWLSVAVIAVIAWGGLHLW